MILAVRTNYSSSPTMHTARLYNDMEEALGAFYSYWQSIRPSESTIQALEDGSESFAPVEKWRIRRTRDFDTYFRSCSYRFYQIDDSSSQNINVKSIVKSSLYKQLISS